MHLSLALHGDGDVLRKVEVEIKAHLVLLFGVQGGDEQVLEVLLDR